jgi:nickel superoxide dismutase
MFYNIIAKLDTVFDFEQVSAHCDIPCKIYDPITIQIAVLSMIRMVELIDELAANKELSIEQTATLARLSAEKEKQGRLVKEEVRVIWGDYFKQPQFDKFPEIHQLTHDIMLKTSAAKQKVNMQLSLDLLVLVNRFADIFWQSKEITTFDAQCPYPPFQTVTYPKLN